MSERPNILFIMSDDHAANAISAYGSRLASVFRTPHIDRLAEEGMLLYNCHCTNAICTPSRATILTGQHSHVNGVRTLEDPLPADARTFVEDFRAAGYATALFGKWHLHAHPRGFDEFSILPGQGLYHDPFFIDPDDDWPADSLYPTGTRHTGHVTDLVAQKTIAWLKQRDRSKPFLLFCHHKAPHDDFEYAERYEHIFDGIEIPEPDSLWEDKSHRSDGSRIYGTSVSDRNVRRNAIRWMSRADYPTGTLDVTGLSADERTRAAYQKYLKDYLRCVRGIDDSVGSLLDYLDSDGIASNTIVVYTSDQGMFLGEHDYIDKRWIFEESLRMPLLVRYPREIAAGGRCDTLVSNLDFARTLLDYADVPAADSFDGRSFRPILSGTTPADWSDVVYNRYWMHMAHHDNPAHYGIRTKEHKLIFFYGLPLDASGAQSCTTPPGWELYDLVNDPYELRNVWSDPAYADARARLLNQLVATKRRIGDTDDRYPELKTLFEETLRAAGIEPPVLSTK
ncbi:MAG: DUF4976 domain-containing protein [Spirochaetaceae bacterium]|nr:MAG: DUF4976 domain-containing protein [Spirochaetaceae bacterium]